MVFWIPYSLRGRRSKSSKLPSEASILCTFGLFGLNRINLGFGFDDEQGVRVRTTGGAEFLTGVVEGIGEDGEDDPAIGTTDEVEATLLLDELGLAGQARTIHSFIGSIHTIRIEIKRKMHAAHR